MRSVCWVTGVLLSGIGELGFTPVNALLAGDIFAFIEKNPCVSNGIHPCLRDRYGPASPVSGSSAPGLAETLKMVASYFFHHSAKYTFTLFKALPITLCRDTRFIFLI